MPTLTKKQFAKLENSGSVQVKRAGIIWEFQLKAALPFKPARVAAHCDSEGAFFLYGEIDLFLFEQHQVRG